MLHGYILYSSKLDFLHRELKMIPENIHAASFKCKNCVQIEKRFKQCVLCDSCTVRICVQQFTPQLLTLK